MLGVEDPAEAERVAARLRALLTRLPWAARAGFHAGIGVLEATSWLVGGGPLAGLGPQRCDAVVRAVAARAEPVAFALKTMMIMARSADRWVPEPGETSRDPWLDCVPVTEWPRRSTADAVVVGSGAGGAVVALELARRGLRTVVVEEGRRFTTADFRGRPPVERFTELYRDGGATVALGRRPVLLPTACGVGGTTLVNSGTCYRTPEAVQDDWRRRWGLPWDLDPLLDEVERILRVAPQPLGVLGRNGELALLGAARLGWRAAPLRRNAPGCRGRGECVAGCPSGAKYGVHLSVLPGACAAGARIVTGARAERILVERGRAAGVVLSPSGAASALGGLPGTARTVWGLSGTDRTEILAPVVVVCAGALQTPLLLRRSGLGDHPHLGRNLRIHPAVSVAGVFDEPVTAWRGVLQSVGIEELHGEGVLIEATGGPPGLSSFVPPGVGRELRSVDGDRLAVLGAMVADGPRGRVYGRRRALLRYDLGPAEAIRLRRAIAAMAEVLFAAGAREVLTGLPGRPRAHSADLLAAVPLDGLHLAGFHPTGTARMGAPEAACPVDPGGRLRGVRGVWVADASVLPTCPTVNPQLTVMAMALAIARRLSGRA
ncbi:putative GMC-type oxidoreductase [Planobispora rosea]|uniref:Putative GMC-type oxidoreductase n=1 Tax=Planobispora rosea TaxID=35762 RepID=A0A8J3WE07_PLARO|nr:GMC family oxidoreductase [Planobispora rosea]GGS70961.1 putative GMC-type oxidoreductase [Planobispora rosea]GIH85412.1 putative GMC-type oxidoreductase [Planobispora rosea]